MQLKDLNPSKPTTKNPLAWLHWWIQCWLLQRSIHTWGMTLEANFQSLNPEVDGWRYAHVVIVIPAMWRCSHLRSLKDKSLVFSYYKDGLICSKTQLHEELWEMNRICHGGCIAPRIA